jgi:hypothetical protein
MAKQPGFYGGSSAADGSFQEAKPKTPNLPGAAVGKAPRTNFPNPKVHKGDLMVMPHKVNGAS